MEVAINRQLFRQGSRGAIPGHSSSSHFTFTETGGVIMREVHGYGPGIFVSREELTKYDHNNLMEAEDGTGSFAIQTSEGPIVPMRRETSSGKQEAREAKQASMEATKSQSANKKAAVDLERKSVVPLADNHFCGLCGPRFLLASGNAAHIIGRWNVRGQNGFQR